MAPLTATARRSTPPNSAPASQKLLPFTPLLTRTPAARSSTPSRLLSTCLHKEKRRATAEGQDAPGQHAPVESPARLGSYLMRTAVSPLGRLRGRRCWAALGLPRRAPQTALWRPEAASRPPGRRLSVGIGPIAMGQGLAGRGAASGPAIVAGKRSGRAITQVKAKPRASRGMRNNSGLRQA